MLSHCLGKHIRASKPIPAVNEIFTSSLEDIIVQRIRNSKFDNIVINNNDKLVGN